MKKYEERYQERIEAIIKRTEDLGEEVLGRIRVWRKTPFSLIDDTSMIHEILVITPHRVFVERMAEENMTPPRARLPGWIKDVNRYVKKRRKTEERLKADVDFAIPKSEIKRVELNNFGWKGVKLNIITSEKEYNWYGAGYGAGLVLPDGWKTGVKLEDYENILRLAFPKKLSVKKNSSLKPISPRGFFKDRSMCGD